MDTGALIANGANAFIVKLIEAAGALLLALSLVVFVLAERESGTLYVTSAFIWGATTSLVAGYISIQVALKANVLTAKMGNDSLAQGFTVAFRGALAIGFIMMGLGLFNLAFLSVVYKHIFLNFSKGVTGRGHADLFEVIAAYALGSSLVALVVRVTGGIFAKSADIGADLVGKITQDLDEDNAKNPGSIIDNIGDNIGPLFGMATDLFASV